MSLTHQAASGVKWRSLALVAKASVQFISVALLARLLSPDDFGLMSMAIVVTGFAQAFSDFGLSNAIIHHQNASREQLSSLYWLNLVVGFCIFILLQAAIPLASVYYQEPRLEPVLGWASLTFLITPFGQQFQSLLRQELRFKTLSLIEIIQGLAYALTAVYFALAGYGVLSLVWGILIQTIVGVTLLISVAKRAHWLPSLHFNYRGLSGFIQFGLFQMGERSLNYISTNIDYLIIGRFLGSEALGYYNLAYNLMRLPVSYINPVVVSVAFPAFARVQHEDALLRKGYAKILHYLSSMTFPIMAGILVVAPLLVPLVYGTQWTPAVPVVRIFALLGIIKSLGNPLSSLLLAKGRADLGFWMNLVGIVGYSISNLIGVRWGIEGVAISSLLASSLILLPIDFYLRWLTVRMSIQNFWTAIKRPTISTSLMLAVLLPLLKILENLGHAVVELTILLIIGVVVYASMTRIFDFPLLVEVWGYLKPTKSFKT